MSVMDGQQSPYRMDGFRERFLDFERLGNEELAVAERQDMTPRFRRILRDKLSHRHPENISIVIYGPPRDGKSYAAISIGRMIWTHLKEITGEEKKMTICRDDSEFLEALKDCGFQDIFIIDEKKNAMVQEGSFVEHEQMQDVDNICAAKCLTVIRLKPQEIFGTNAMITLKTHGRDRKNKRTRLLVKVRELNAERWIGHIIVGIAPILCGPRFHDEVGACSVCPHFQVEENHPILWRCSHFIADYERRKLENIEHVMEGDVEARARIIHDIAEEIAHLPEWATIKGKDAKILYVRLIAPDKSKLTHYTNRRLTQREIEQIVAWADHVYKTEVKET